MEARTQRAVAQTVYALVVSLIGLVMLPAACQAAAGYRTKNFVVSALTPQLAKEIGDTAETWRKELSIEWLGSEMPPWSKPCPIHARVAPNLGAGGATSFVFDRGEVFGWRMNIQGTRERILDSVLPHEITHTIFASHFRRPLPRWADEGACTTVEHRSEIAKQERMLIDFLKTGRGIPFSAMFAMKEYPQDVMPLYSQGHSLAQWLIESRGKQAFLEFLADGMQDENWPRAVQKHYGHRDLYAMQSSWLDWVKQGRPSVVAATVPASQGAGRLASHSVAGSRESIESSRGGSAIYRGQSPDDIGPVAPAAAQAASNGSVYAAVVARAQQSAPGEATVVTAPGQSVYDASLPGSTLRR